MVWDEKRKPRGIALYVCLSAVCLCLSLSVRPKGRGRCKLERGNLQTCSGLSRDPAPSRWSRVAPTSGRSPLPVCSMLSLGLIISFLRSLEAALPHSCQCLTSLQCRTFVVAGLVPPSSSCIPKTLYNRITPPLFRFGDLQTFVRKKTTGLVVLPNRSHPPCPFAMVLKRGAALALLGSCALLVAVIVISGRGQESSELLLKVDMMAHEPYSPPSNMWVSPLSPPPLSLSLSSLSPFLSLFPSLTLIPPLSTVECSNASRKSCRLVEGSFSTLVAGAGHDHVWSSSERSGGSSHALQSTRRGH